MIKTVAKISFETAYGIESFNEEGEKVLLGGIAGHKIPNTNTSFNPVEDKEGNIVISLITAQYLNADQYEVIDWNPKDNSDL